MDNFKPEMEFVNLSKAEYDLIYTLYRNILDNKNLIEENNTLKQKFDEKQDLLNLPLNEILRRASLYTDTAVDNITEMYSPKNNKVFHHFDLIYFYPNLRNFCIHINIINKDGMIFFPLIYTKKEEKEIFLIEEILNFNVECSSSIRLISLKLICLIANYYHISIDWLLTKHNDTFEGENKKFLEMELFQNDK